MDTRQAYNAWASQYDTNLNKTRDLEARALRETLGPVPFVSCLEIGCGTGKNTTWFVERTQHVTAVDISEEMLAKAREKVSFPAVEFRQADITAPWTVDCYDHHLSDFTHLPRQYGLAPVLVNEYFDEDDRGGIPRIITVLLKKGHVVS